MEGSSAEELNRHSTSATLELCGDHLTSPPVEASLIDFDINPLPSSFRKHQKKSTTATATAAGTAGRTATSSTTTTAGAATRQPNAPLTAAADAPLPMPKRRKETVLGPKTARSAMLADLLKITSRGCVTVSLDEVSRWFVSYCWGQWSEWDGVNDARCI